MTTQTPGAAASIRNGQLIDLTTTGRRSGGAKRLEIVIFSFDGRLYISGMPGVAAGWPTWRPIRGSPSTSRVMSWRTYRGGRA